MLFNNNLEEIVFHRHELFQSDELIIVSGYVGPAPVRRLEELPLNSTVIYGMYGSDGIQARLHSSLTDLDNSIHNAYIYYSNTPVHAKCYIWRHEGQVVHALIGSANFSTNGLSTPFKEILAETTYDTFDPLNRYLATIMDNSIRCINCVPRLVPQRTGFVITTQPAAEDICPMVLYDPITGEVQPFAGLNWGQSPTAHVTPNDAYIPIRTAHIRNFPQLFPIKQTFPTVTTGLGRQHRHNDAIDIIWDDGTAMTGLLEGSQPVDGRIYPKQISSHPEKRAMGEYIRRRIGVPLDGRRITMADLRRYGRTNIDISLQGEGIYFFDFSVH